MVQYYTKQERLQIVLNIINQLKNYECPDGEIIDIFKDSYSYKNEFQKLLNDYVKQDENNLKEFNGKIFFEEIGRYLQYKLPIKTYKKYEIILTKSKI